MTKDRVRAVLAAVEGLGKSRVLVGVPAEEAYRRPEPGEPPTPINNADIGYIDEFGSPAQNIPPRPHLIPGVQEAQERLGDLFESGGRAILAGRDVTEDRILHSAGLVAQASVRGYITNGPHAPLAPATIAKRRAKGRTGSKPLIDTAQYRNSINYVIRPVGE